MRLIHNVYFTLSDPSQAAIDKLIAACNQYLRPQPGVELFAAGELVVENHREVNDVDWHVGLHMVFSSADDQEVYQNDPLHHVFIAENKANWAKVRVFDTQVE